MTESNPYRNWLAFAAFWSLLSAEITYFALCPPRIQQAIEISNRDTVPSDTLPCQSAENMQSRKMNNDSLWAKIDRHALAAPLEVEDSAQKLAQYLCTPKMNDWEKVRAIFRWITDRIRYDDIAYNSGRYGLADVQVIFQIRRGVCEDYANLFNLLTAEVGIPSKKIVGFSKGFTALHTRNSLEPDHAWNAVFVDSSWHLMDVTWAAGYGQTHNGRLNSTKKFEDYWFDTDPTEFIFTHLPSEGRWQLLDTTLSVAEFECLPMVSADFFKLGYAATPILKDLKQGIVYEVPHVFMHPFDVQVLDAPKVRDLEQGDSLQLRFTCSNCKGMTAQTGGRMLDFEQMDSLFCLDIKPKKGKMGVFARKRRYATWYDGIMEFQVRRAALALRKQP